MTTDELVGANGLFQMGTSLAILTGMMLAGVLMKLDSPLFWISGVTVLWRLWLLGFSVYSHNDCAAT